MLPEYTFPMSTVCQSQCMARVQPSAPKPNLNWRAEDTDQCQQLTDEKSCTQDKTCEWKSPCHRGVCPRTFPPTVHLATSSPEQDDPPVLPGSLHYVWHEGAGPSDDGQQHQTTYTGCQTATPARCHTLAAEADRTNTDEARKLADDCQGCLSYQQGQHCGTDVMVVLPSTGQGNPTTYSFPSTRRPCLCDPANACCQGVRPDGGPLWLVGGDGTCPIPTQSPEGYWYGGGGSVDMLQQACADRDKQLADQGGCHWSEASKSCVPKACEYRTDSATCNKSTHGQSTADDTYTCVWIGTQGGSGRCIHADCHNRCDVDSCLSVVEDDRLGRQGPCMWINNVAGQGDTASTTSPLISMFCQQGHATGMCVPEHCSEKGKFQPSYIDPGNQLVPSTGRGDLVRSIHDAETWGRQQCNLNPPELNVQRNLGQSCGDVRCSETEQCVYQHGAKRCQPAGHVPHCEWHPQASNPTAGICPSIVDQDCTSLTSRDSCQLHKQCSWDDDRQRCSTADDNATKYVRARTLSKGICAETNQSMPQHANLSGVVLTPAPNTVFEAYHRSASYDYDCNCHFAPLGSCEKETDAEQCIRKGCHLVEGKCVSNAYSYCLDSCSVIESPPQYVCPSPCPEVRDFQQTPDQQCSLSLDSSSCQNKRGCAWHASEQDGVVGMCMSSNAKAWVAHHTVAPDTVHRCTSATQKAGCPTKDCVWVDQDGGSCQARPMLEVDHVPVSCEEMEQCDSCKEAHWGPESSRSCTSEAEHVATKRNNCLAQCMSQPRQFCQHHCAASNCTAMCMRTEVTGMHTWKGTSACRHNKMDTQPQHDHWVQECAHNLQQPCLDLTTGAVVQDTPSPTGGAVLSDAMCEKTGHGWARPSMHQDRKPYSPRAEAYFCSPRPVDCDQYQTAATCNDIHGCAWAQETCQTTGQLSQQCRQHNNEQACIADELCLWDDEAQCQAKAACNHATMPCNPEVCDPTKARTSSERERIRAYCPCQKDAVCAKMPMCSIAWDRYVHAGVDHQEHSAKALKHCPTNKCALHHQESCKQTCRHQHSFDTMHHQQAPQSAPPTCPANMPWRYGNATAGGMYCCDHYLGSTMNRKHTAALSDCTHHGADGTYTDTHFVAQHPAKGCCLTPEACWADEHGQLPLNCDGTKHHGVSCRYVHRNPFKELCSPEVLTSEPDWAAPCGEVTEPSLCALTKDTHDPSTYPPACVLEQCRHHYCHPTNNPDLVHQFPAELQQRHGDSSIQGWAGCAAGYCLKSKAWCSTDADCGSPSDKCVMECGVSGLGCYPLWHDGPEWTGTCPGPDLFSASPPDAKGARKVYYCDSAKSATKLLPLVSSTHRPRAFPSPDVDACLQAKCIHNEGIPVPYVAAYTDAEPCRDSPSYPTMQACQADLQRLPGVCPQACPRTPQPLHLSQEECGPSCSQDATASPCWLEADKVCIPRIPLDEMPCRNAFHCWGDGLCFPRPDEYQRCQLPPPHLRQQVGLDEVSCRHIHDLCWQDGKCYRSMHAQGCQVPERKRLIPMLADGTAANSSTTKKACLDSGHCWLPCASALGKAQHAACQTACTMSSNHACFVPPEQRVHGLGDTHSAASCLASSHANCWDPEAQQCYLGGTLRTATQAPGDVPAGQACPLLHAQSLEGWQCAPCPSQDCSDCADAEACAECQRNASAAALCWRTQTPRLVDTDDCVLDDSCPVLGQTCNTADGSQLTCRPTANCPACWTTELHTEPPCSCPLDRPFYRNGACQAIKQDEAVTTSLLPPTTVFTWEGVHEPVELDGLYELGPCLYWPRSNYNPQPEPADNKLPRCPQQLKFPGIPGLGLDHLNSYAPVVAISTHMPRLVNSLALQQTLPVGPQPVPVKLSTRGRPALSVDIQLEDGMWNVLDHQHNWTAWDEVTVQPQATTLRCPLSHPHQHEQQCCDHLWSPVVMAPLGTCTASDTMCQDVPETWAHYSVPPDHVNDITSCRQGCALIPTQQACDQAAVCQWDADGGICQARDCSRATSYQACHAINNCLWQEGTAATSQLDLRTSYPTLAEAEAACMDCAGAAVLGVPGHPQSTFTAYYLLTTQPPRLAASLTAPAVDTIVLPAFGKPDHRLSLDHVPHKDARAVPGVTELYHTATFQPDVTRGDWTPGPVTVSVHHCPEHQILVDGRCEDMTITHAWTARPNHCPGEQCAPNACPTRKPRCPDT